MENQSGNQQMTTSAPSKKKIYKYGLATISLVAAIFIGSSYKTMMENRIDVDRTITSTKISIEKYKKCYSEKSCKPEDEQNLSNALEMIEAVYSRGFVSLGKYLGDEDVNKIKSLTKETISDLVDMNMYRESSDLIEYSREYIKPEEIKEAVKKIYENKPSADKVRLFSMTRLLNENGYYFEGATLAMSMPDHIPLATGHRLMDTFFSFGCRDDLLVWGSYYSKLIPDLFLRDETQYLSKQEYFKLIRSVDSDTLDKINKTSSDMVLLKKYPELSANCQVKRFSLYN